MAGRSGTPSRQSRGIDPPVAIRRGEGAQIMWCLEPRCSPRVRPVCWGSFWVASRVKLPFHTSRRNEGLLLKCCSGHGPHRAMTGKARCFSRVAEGFSWYVGEIRLPLVLAQGSPNFQSTCKGELGVALESMQGKRDLT